MEGAWARAPPCRRPSAQILHGRYLPKKGWGHECGGPHLGEAWKLNRICPYLWGCGPGSTCKNSHSFFPSLTSLHIWWVMQ